MKVTETKLKGCFVIEPAVFKDDRGYFFESFNSNGLNTTIKQKINFVQDNQSFSYKGVIRAIHYQTGEFSVLSDTAEFFYKCDNFYNKASEGGIIYNDPDLNIDWQLPPDKIKVSPKDLELPTLKYAQL